MELYYGAFNKAELFQLKKFVQLFEIIEVILLMILGISLEQKREKNYSTFIH